VDLTSVGHRGPTAETENAEPDLRMQGFESTEKVTGKILAALTQVSKHGYRNDYKSFMHHGKGVSLSKGNTVREILCK
jgi:hypothetical protein